VLNGLTPLVDLDALRIQYETAGIDVASLADDPIIQFAVWLDDAIAADVPEPNAMTMSTVDADGPDARVVLLKGVDQRGFSFYTNFESVKGAQIDADARAALTFHWQPLHRQVRVRGTVARVADDEADSYYGSRPRSSQVGAWASPQSRPIADRSLLERAVEEVQRRFGDDEPTRPPHWGGFRVTPLTVEFWQGQPDRLHDRVQYQLTAKGWTRRRLAP
jgi:pyridoxamine 5'-phosphate oxidase